MKRNFDGFLTLFCTTYLFLMILFEVPLKSGYGAFSGLAYGVVLIYLWNTWKR